MALLTCQSCARHVKPGSDACPFCGGTTLLGSSPSVRKRVTRAVLVAGAASVAVACSSSTVAMYGAPYPVDSGTSDANASDAAKDSGVPDAPIAAYGLPPFDAGIQDSSKE